ncbi:MAG: penicillin-binding protein 1A [Gammaproteobacteria bacterium]|nr:penicillin-binding protein 1A [Gammaproteobacteria bacterium]
MNTGRIAFWTGLVLLILALLAGLSAVAAFYVGKAIYADELPSNEEIKSLPLQVPLRIFTEDGKLIGEFGAERRAPVAYADLPPQLMYAFIAAEDEHYFEHPGVDWRGLLRAGVNLVLTGHKTQGGSTITMQLARNYFLSNERTYTRKFKEILLALRMERELGKQLILETYLNKIYLGQRAYGVGAAAQIYFGKSVGELSLSQCAVLAGLPKAPSRDNPIDNPVRAEERRNYVLGRMLDIGRISRDEYQIARAEPVHAEFRPRAVDIDAHYVAEMARADAVARFGDDTYTGGYSVITTLNSKRQLAAVAALRKTLLDYQERHGYSGPEGRLPQALTQQLATDPESAREAVAAALNEQPRVAELPAAAVIRYADQQLRAMLPNGEVVSVGEDGLEWAALSSKNALTAGDVIRLHRDGESWRLSAVPEVQGALVSLDPHDGAVQALVGGYDFFTGKFNRATQARRQPGSGIKPFLYTAAMSAGFTPASVILDAPVVFDDPLLEDAWRPKNDSGKFYGPTRMREALVHSRNLVSIRLLQAIGINYARDFISRFGFDEARMPHDLTLALGTPTFTPMEMARGFSVFANGGFLIEPYWIREIRGPHDEELFKAEPVVACPECADAQAQAAMAEAQTAPETDDPQATTQAPGAMRPTEAEASMADDAAAPPLAPRVVDPRLIYLADSMLQDVTRRGTGYRTRELGRNDIAGKTGTTNDATDAWFFGYQPSLVAAVWVGFDQPTPLGRGEYGGRAALPAWVQYMRVALDGIPEATRERPPGLATVRINPENGKLAAAGDPDAIFEIVPSENIPEPDNAGSANPYDSDPYNPFGPGGGGGGGASGNGDDYGDAEPSPPAGRYDEAPMRSEPYDPDLMEPLDEEPRPMEDSLF